MSPPRRGDGTGDLAEVRERLARLETLATAHEQAGVERHQQLLVAVGVLQDRLGRVEARSWRLAIGLTLVGVGGGASGMSLLRFLVG